MNTLIQIQAKCLDRMHEPRTSEKRAKKNRSAALRGMREELAKKGYEDHDIEGIIQDVVDMYHLEVNAEEAV